MFDWQNAQNSDGGWAYSKGTSWTEPTVFALLAQVASRIDPKAFEAGLRFLRSQQRADGGWSPQPEVAESTWVTALVTLLPEDALGRERMSNGLKWLSGQTGRESGWRSRLQQAMAGNKEPFPDGWPYYPGAAAWVIPTSLGILSFDRALKRNRDTAGLKKRVDAGLEFLAARMCADGGWNHGGNHALGREIDSYPETTGMALLALKASGDQKLIERGKTAARRHLGTCRTAEGIAWLRIGLAAHGEQRTAPAEPVQRTNTDVALTILADAPPQRNPLLV